MLMSRLCKTCRMTSGWGNAFSLLLGSDSDCSTQACGEDRRHKACLDHSLLFGPHWGSVAVLGLFRLSCVWPHRRDTPTSSLLVKLTRLLRGDAFARNIVMVGGQGLPVLRHELAGHPGNAVVSSALVLVLQGWSAVRNVHEGIY